MLTSVFDAPAATGLAELLANHAVGGCVMDRSRVLRALTGSLGVMDREVDEKEPATWRRSTLEMVLLLARIR